MTVRPNTAHRQKTEVLLKVVNIIMNFCFSSIHFNVFNFAVVVDFAPYKF